MNTVIFSTWLLPKSKDRRLLSQLIVRLARKFNAPIFMPHVTVYACVMPQEKVGQAIQKTQNACFGLTPFSLAVKGINHSPEYFKAVHLTLTSHPTLDSLHRRLRDNLQIFTDYQLEPHLSLLYKVLDEAERMQIVSQLSVPQAITFADIGYVIHENWQTEHHRVEKWRYNALCHF